MLEVFYVVHSPYSHRYYVMGVPFFPIEYEFATFRTLPFLVFCYRIKLGAFIEASFAKLLVALVPIF
jgi:hypothetical protein